MTRKAATGKLDVELEAALAAEVKEIQRKHPEDHEKKGEFVYDVLERMRVYDRALKLQAIKVKLDDPEWGKEFNK